MLVLFDAPKIISRTHTNNLISFLLFHGCIALLGYILLMATHVPGAQYLGTFLAASGVYV